MIRPLSGLGRSLRVFPSVLGNRELRRVALAYATFTVAELATWYAIMIFAYERGGTAAVGLVGVVQLVPAAAFAPFAGILGDRYRRERVLAAGYLVQAVAMGAAAVALFVEASTPTVYALAALATVSEVVSRPTQAALLPTLVREPEELIAANVAIGVIERASMFVGPALAGLLLGGAGPAAVFAVMGGGLLTAAFFLFPLGTRAAPQGGGSGRGATAVVDDLAGGVRALFGERKALPVVAVIVAQFVVLGALDVLLVVLAIELLGSGSAVGFLSAAIGIGGIVGAGASVALVSRRLAPAVVGGALFSGTALVVTGLVSGLLIPPLLVATGAGRPLVDVAGRTLLQRVVPGPVLARVFGLLEGLAMAGLTLGVAVAPALVALIGARGGTVAVGLLVPVVALLVWPRLVAADTAATVPEREIQLLRTVPLFAPLSAPVLERLAARLIPIAAAAGTSIVREGERGDRFYVVEMGEVVVTVGGREIEVHGPGGFFGEVALIRAVPRTATVTALSDVTLYALEREDFLEAVTGQPESAAAADAISEERVRRATEAAANPPAD
jgi:hypothetical protein